MPTTCLLAAVDLFTEGFVRVNCRYSVVGLLFAAISLIQDDICMRYAISCPYVIYAEHSTFYVCSFSHLGLSLLSLPKSQSTGGSGV